MIKHRRRRSSPDKYGTLVTPKQAFKLALLGLTDEELADVWDIDLNTLSLWKRVHPDFRAALNRGKRVANAQVVHALYKRAKGFSIMEDHISMYRGEIIRTPVRKYFPPDSWAANKFLSVRERDKWTDIQRVESIETHVKRLEIDMGGLSMDQLMMLKQIADTKQLPAANNGTNVG